MRPLFRVDTLRAAYSCRLRGVGSRIPTSEPHGRGWWGCPVENQVATSVANKGPFELGGHDGLLSTVACAAPLCLKERCYRRQEVEPSQPGACHLASPQCCKGCRPSVRVTRRDLHGAARCNAGADRVGQRPPRRHRTWHGGHEGHGRHSHASVPRQHLARCTPPPPQSLPPSPPALPTLTRLTQGPQGTRPA